MGQTAALTPTERTATPDPGFRGLAALIGVGEVAGFLQRRLGQDAYRTRMAPGAARALFGWPTLNAALAQHRLSPPRLRLEQGGDATAGAFKTRRTRRGAVLHDLDPAVLTERLRGGATLILDAANEVSPPLQALCAALSAEFRAACQANLYACWGTSQGFDVHWDDHDVFVIQVEGAKLWRLYGSTQAAPTRRDPCAPQERPASPLEETVLEPGDVLYLPRGYWHAAVGLGGPTMHLTVGLTRKTGADLLHWLIDQTVTEDTVRRDLPLEQTEAALGAHIAGLLATLSSKDPAELGRLYRRHVEAAQAHRPKLSFPFIGAAGEVPAGMKISLADGSAGLRRAERTDAVVLSFRGTEYTVAAELHAALDALVSGQALTQAEFTTRTEPAARALVPEFIARMTGEGVFVIAHEPGA